MNLEQVLDECAKGSLGRPITIHVAKFIALYPQYRNELNWYAQMKLLSPDRKHADIKAAVLNSAPTTTTHDDYRQATTSEHIEPCPVCSGTARLWHYSEKPTEPVRHVVMCETSDPIGPRNGIVNEGCLLTMPPDDFYRETDRDALDYWNEHAIALRGLRGEA